MTLYVCLIEKVINNILLRHFFETKGLWWIRETNLEQSVYNVIAPSGVTFGRREEKLMFAKVENAKGKEVTYSELYLRNVCITKNWGTFLCNIYWDNMPITVMIFCYAWKVLNLVLCRKSLLPSDSFGQEVWYVLPMFSQAFYVIPAQFVDTLGLTNCNVLKPLGGFNLG